MILLKKGSLSKPRPWWHRKDVKCPKCGCEAMLEEGDGVTETAERHPGGKRTVTAKCPTTDCDGALTATTP